MAEIEMINKTGLRWTKVHQHSYQMSSWTFPDTVEAGQDGYCYLDFESGTFMDEEDDAGEARYRIEGGYEFEVRARNAGGHQISVVNINLPRKVWGYQKDQVQIQWDGTMTFILPG